MFPVELQNIQLADGRVVSGKAIVRTDTNQVLSVVSNRYRLVRYEEVLDKAESFVKQFGEPTREVHLSENGSKMAAVYTYKESNKEIMKDDIVGLRIYLRNSYTPGQSIQCKIGALRLKCLNGMVSSKSLFEYTINHTGKEVELKFPEPVAVMDQYSTQVDFLKTLTQKKLTETEFNFLGEKAVEQGIVPSPALKENPDRDLDYSAWKLYNQMTYYVNHAGKASPIGKIRSLDRIDRFFHSAF
jgi:hypothetical protein